jgi:hypothetical protein
VRTFNNALIVTALATVAMTVLAQSPASRDAGPATSTPTHLIVVSYFHGDFRCPTCKKIEAYSRDAVEKTFAKELATGRLAFKAVNIDRAENEHFIHDYSLVTRSLVVTEESDGKVVRWTNLDKIWEFVRGDQQAFTDYVAVGVRAYLGPTS